MSCYSDGDCKELRALMNSSGLLELFLDQASAAESMGLLPGKPVIIKVE